MNDSEILGRFDMDHPELDGAIRRRALASGGFPYAEKLGKKAYGRRLLALQIELVKLNEHMGRKGGKLALVFEGRDAAGKGGAIKAYSAHVNPRYNRIAALPKPNDRERTQWYFQRYVSHLPADGETVLFDRSWYNRAGVEPVMGFCTPLETAQFLSEAPRFERMVVDSNVVLFKFYLDIGREMQMKRFHDRRHDPLKTWKLSPVDLEALVRWDAYSVARDTMLDTTDSEHAPWIVVRANDKKRARLAVLQTVLGALEYEGKDLEAIGRRDPAIALSAQAFLAARSK